jgi:hypothetical protein
VFAPEARAFIRLPSRSPAHEFERRRRIVSQSLHGLSLMRELLNPFRYGAFAVGLLINKVLRRCTPVFMVLLALGSVGLAPRHGWAAALLAVQASAQK